MMGRRHFSWRTGIALFSTASWLACSGDARRSGNSPALYLGPPRAAVSEAPPHPAAPAELQAMGTGFDHACALKGEGVWCWGRARLGREKAGSELAGPVRVSLGPVADLEVRDGGSCAVMKDATVECWGKVPGVSSEIPTPLPGLSGVRAVKFDQQSMCLHFENGSVLCNDPRDPRWRPVGLPVMATIDAGDAVGFCGIGRDGSVHRWSVRREEQRALEGLPAGAIDVACGMGAVCTLYPDGGVWCTEEEALEPGKPRRKAHRLALQGVRSIEMTDENMCVLHFDGTTMCWGDERLDRRKDVSHAAQFVPRRMEAPAFTRIFLDQWNLCGVTRAGQLSCAGSDDDGQLGRGPYQPRAKRMSGFPRVQELVVMGPERCVLVEGGELRCWSGSKPDDVVALAAKAAAAAWSSTCFADPAGAVRCRRNDRGELTAWKLVEGLSDVERLAGLSIGGEAIGAAFLAATKTGALYTFSADPMAPARPLVIGRQVDAVGGHYDVSMARSGGDLLAWRTEFDIVDGPVRPIRIKPQLVARNVGQLNDALYQAKDGIGRVRIDHGSLLPVTEAVPEDNLEVPFAERLQRGLGRPIAVADVDNVPPDVVQRLDPCVLTASGQLWCWLYRSEAHPADARVEIRF